MRYARVLALGLALGAFMLVSAGPARGSAFTVDTKSDAVDADPGDGVCATADGLCSLRAAIQETNALAGPDSINLPEGTHTLSIAGADEDAAAAGDLDITDDLTITGGGADATVIDGGALDRVFHTLSLFGAEPSVEMTGLAARNGATAEFDPAGSGGAGGGIFNGSGVTLTLTNVTVTANWASHGGGGIANGGALTLINSAVTGNTGGVAVEGDGGGGLGNSGTATLVDSLVSGNRSGLSGGGIENGGTLTLERSTVSGNTVDLFTGGGISSGGTLAVTNSSISGNTVGIDGFPDRGEGGGIIIVGGSATIANSTISGNTANVLGGGIANGFFLRPQVATLVLTNVTVADNSASSGAGIYNSVLGSAEVKNTIVADSAAGDNCAGPITSAGHNLEDADSCGFTGPGDLANGDPVLGPLQDNGGPTLTQALLPGFEQGDALFFGSFAIDAGDDSACPETDQRGFPRPVDGNGDGVAVCDIGAYEAPEGTSPPTPTPTPAPTPSATPTAAPASLPRSGGAPPAADGGSDVPAVAMAGALGMTAAGLIVLSRIGIGGKRAGRGTTGLKQRRSDAGSQKGGDSAIRTARSANGVRDTGSSARRDAGRPGG